jgi:hypothetical protein
MAENSPTTKKMLDHRWLEFNYGKTIGQRGSEQGIIIQDESHPLGARITLEEECQASPFAITWGISGWMVHTHFLSTRSDAEENFEVMKIELESILNGLSNTNDRMGIENDSALSEIFENFVRQFP